MDAGPLITTVSDSVYKLIKYGILAAAALGFTILFITSVLVHDTHYIKTHPKFFLSETIIMGLLSSLPIIYISWLRGGSKVETLQEFTLIFVKIALLHIGFQLSGVYAILFPKTA